MNTVTLFGLTSTKEIRRELYVGSKAEDTILFLVFEEDKLVQMYTSDKEEGGYINFLELKKQHPLELKYLEKRFKSRKDKLTLSDYKEELDKELLDYLKLTDRLTDRDYDYFLNKLEWAEDIKEKTIFAYFCFHDMLPGCREEDDSLVIVYSDEGIIELYSCYTDDDESGREIVVDRYKLDIGLLSNDDWISLNSWI